jgi:hypothetical protein
LSPDGIRGCPRPGEGRTGSQKELARGNTEKGFYKLDEFSVIQEVEDQAKRSEVIAQKHVEVIKEKKSSSVVAPTYGECRQIAKAVRQAMRNEGILAPEEQTFSRLEKLNLTSSQRRDSINYESGNAVQSGPANSSDTLRTWDHHCDRTKSMGVLRSILQPQGSTPKS